MKGKNKGIASASTTVDTNRIDSHTFDWEALDFYKKLGFYVEFERKGFDKNSVFYFLRKDLI